MRQKITLFFIKKGIQLFRWIPFFGIYLLADFLTFVFKYVIKYRKEVILSNLQNAFPNAADDFYTHTLSGTYKNLSDITLEALKGLILSEKEIKKRYVIKNPEILEEAFVQGKSIILCGAHYGNWEWGVRSWSLWFRHKVYGIYKPLANKTIEGYLNERRSDFGMRLIDSKQARAALEEGKTKPCIYVLFGDQTPHNTTTCHWLPFLHQDTAWLQGVGEIAHQRNFPVYYIHIKRVKRGFYESEIIPLVLHPTALTPYEISVAYAAMVEKHIQAAPSDWLWSHKRWKHKR